MFIEESLNPTQLQKNSQQLIVVVDEARIAHQLIVNLLVDSGYDGEEARDGARGYQAVQNDRYDLVITDNTMPKRTGVETTEKLRSAHMTVPIILATGFMTIFIFARRSWLKADAALTTLFSNDELPAIVKTFWAGAMGMTLLKRHFCRRIFRLFTLWAIK